jgi:hypothetical protein
MSKVNEKNEEPTISFDHDQQQMFRNENEAPHATRSAEAEDEIETHGAERPGSDVKKEINPNTE